MRGTHVEPPTSAPIFDFSCLFTFDLKRKSKRWQDGRFKFHTFNKRVMVYDDRGGFIGDAYVGGEDELGEYNEISLDRGGAIVQVGQHCGTHIQDLTQIFARKPKDHATPAQDNRQHPSTSASVRANPRSRSSGILTTVPNRPLHSILSTPKGVIGRATIPTVSPFEERQQQSLCIARQSDAPPPPKRARHEDEDGGDNLAKKNSYAKTLFGQTLSLSSQQVSSPSELHLVSASTKSRSIELYPAAPKACPSARQVPQRDNFPSAGTHPAAGVGKKAYSSSPCGQTLSLSSHLPEHHEAVGILDVLEETSGCASKGIPVPLLVTGGLGDRCQQTPRNKQLPRKLGPIPAPMLHGSRSHMEPTTQQARASHRGAAGCERHDSQSERSNIEVPKEREKMRISKLRKVSDSRTQSSPSSPHIGSATTSEASNQVSYPLNHPQEEEQTIEGRGVYIPPPRRKTGLMMISGKGSASARKGTGRTRASLAPTLTVGNPCTKQGSPKRNKPALAARCSPPRNDSSDSGRGSSNSDCLPTSSSPRQKTTMATRQASSRPQLKNPATRGKKAATSSDAAGLPPPDVMLPRPPDQIPNASLPEFARRDQGPWSRHTHELFIFAGLKDKAL